MSIDGIMETNQYLTLTFKLDDEKVFSSEELVVVQDFESPPEV